jgi:hypothetical protein
MPEWRKRAREKLAGPTTMREKAWTHLFITGKTPAHPFDFSTTRMPCFNTIRSSGYSFAAA